MRGVMVSITMPTPNDLPTVKIETLRPVKRLSWSPTFLDEGVHRRGDVVQVDLTDGQGSGATFRRSLETFVLSLGRTKARLLSMLLAQHADRLPVDEDAIDERRQFDMLFRMAEDHVTTKRYDVVSQDGRGGSTFHDEYETWDDATAHALHIKGVLAWQHDHVYIRDHSTTPSKRFEIDESGQCKEVAS